MLPMRLMMPLAAVFAGAMVAASQEPGAAQADPVTATVKPDTVFREARGALTRLNFDVRLANSGDSDVEVSYLELRAFDARGRIVARRYMGSNGNPGPITMLPARTVPAGGGLYLFNPFPDLDAPRPPARVVLRIFHGAGSERLDIDLAEPPGPELARPPMGQGAYIYSGNDLLAHHRRVTLDDPSRQHVAQRYALDFTRLDPGTGALARGDGASLTDWLAWDTEIVAPVDGEVVALRADMPDNRMDAAGQRVFIDDFERYGADASLGNFVVLRVEDAHLLMAHFRRGTLSVSVGDRVRAGEALGRLGLSGDTAYPHLHIQLQDGPDPLAAPPSHRVLLYRA